MSVSSMIFYLCKLSPKMNLCLWKLTSVPVNRR